MIMLSQVGDTLSYQSIIPIQALAVQFPDGHTAYSTISNSTIYEPLVSIRLADLNFVLESVRDRKVPSLQIFDLNTNRVGIFGHSLSEATAISALANDTRFAAGVNHNGTMYGDVLKLSNSAFVLLMNQPGYNQSEDPSWNDVWQRLRGWGLQLQTDLPSHHMYSDLSFVTEVLGGSLAGLLDEDPNDGTRAFELVWTYTVAFFGNFLKGKGEGVLGAASKAFSEVVFENRTERVIA
ncbi:MAG: hypothetical protein Q9195_005816 [Heterodermia aff. obscurata]